MAELNLSDKLGIFPGFRMDYYNDFGLAMSPSLGVNYQFIDEELYIHTQASRNFRAPTFNDLYWPQGGNENLDPETAVKLEAGIGITDNWIGIGDHDLTFFRADISNGIRWTPGASAFFQAQNYLSLLSYGVEWTASKDFQIGAYKINYTQSSFEKQNIRASLYGNWVSERFSTEQNNLRNPEPSYFVLDASVGYSKTINQTIISLGFQVNNVLDEQYEVVRLYPQPLRNFLITLTIKQKTN